MARIIVADDDELVGELVCNALIDAGHSAGWVTDGKQALRTILERRPDLLVLDCNMPEMSGMLLLRELRQKPEFFGLPVMVLSGRRGDADVDLAYFNGADDYMKKPFEPKEVAFRVDQLLAKHSQKATISPRRSSASFGRRSS